MNQRYLFNHDPVRGVTFVYLVMDHKGERYGAVRHHENEFLPSPAEGTGILDYGGRRWMKVQMGAELPIFLTLDHEVVTAIQNEFDPPTQPASARHLDDAIHVREQLFGLLEVVIKENHAE